jgi:hypothetical protein
LSGRALIGDAPLALRPLALTLGGGVAVRAVLTDAEGRFAMNDIPDDYYTLVAIVEDRPGAEAVGNSIFRHPVQVEGGEVSGDFVFTAGPTVTVIGRVVGSAASAAPILSLTGLASTIPPGSSRAGQFTREIAPDFSGLFQVPLVPAGTYQLALVAGAMRRPILTNIRVTGEAPLVDLGDVEIQAGGSLRIVLDGDGINRTTPIEVAVDQDLTALEPGVTPFGWISVRFPPGKSEHVIADIAPTRLVLQTTIGRGGSAYGSIDEVTREFGYETPDSQVRAEIVGGVEAEAVIRLRAYTFLRMQPSSPSRPVSRFVMTRVETGQVMDLPILPSPATEEYLKSEPNYAFISAGHPFVKGIEPGRWQVDYTTPGGTFRLLFDLQPGDPILTIQRSLVPQERIGPPPGEARFN